MPVEKPRSKCLCSCRNDSRKANAGCKSKEHLNRSACVRSRLRKKVITEAVGPVRKMWLTRKRARAFEYSQANV